MKTTSVQILKISVTSLLLTCGGMAVALAQAAPAVTPAVTPAVSASQAGQSLIEAEIQHRLDMANEMRDLEKVSVQSKIADTTADMNEAEKRGLKAEKEKERIAKGLPEDGKKKAARMMTSLMIIHICAVVIPPRPARSWRLTFRR